ncbi:TPA: hypothetical protein DDW35_02890 [Candidatus Sumerlaeota bacterium]|nr:hypothetical protein [Candidatus Sumerlaeota bacterium]
MGDVLTLVEKAQENFNEEEAQAMAEKMRKASFTFDDFLKQMKQMRKMGSFSSLMKFIPGMGQLMEHIDEDQMEGEIRRAEAIVHSMTLYEREHPEAINASRKARVAKGCGQGVDAVNRLIREFETARKMMKQLMGGGKMGMLKSLMGGGGGGAVPGRSPLMPSGKGKGKKKDKKKKSR